MNFGEKILDLGISSGVDGESRKRIRIINFMSAFSLALTIMMMVYSAVVQIPLLGYISAFCAICMSIPLALNAIGKILASRIFFLCISYGILLMLPIIFGPELHYQYWLVAGIGMPLLFLHEEIGSSKWILVFVAIPIFLFLEWHYTQKVALITLDADVVYGTRIFNDILLFLTVASMFFVFIKQNQKQVREIEKQQDRLKELNSDLEQFAYIVSHDLKAPVRNIRQLITFIEEDHGERLNFDVMEKLQLVKSRSERMEDLIKSILSYSKTGSEPEDVTEFKLNDLIDELVEVLSLPSSFHIHYRKDLPLMEGSYTQLQQVLTNLIGNAVKYHNKDKGIISVEVFPHHNGLIKVEVTDDGPGIKSQYQKHLFGMFSTANENSRTESTGIGLAIVKKLVEANGGVVGLESSYGHGSTFWFTWPLKVSKRVPVLPI